ncbi:MAG TPA: hypothetical protein VJ652_22315, partial [Noviherbaspirillum sp.]|nr:hypothetical protein [Noviherbaspirillum sp.]
GDKNTLAGIVAHALSLDVYRTLGRRSPDCTTEGCSHSNFYAHCLSNSVHLLAEVPRAPAIGRSEG